MSEGASLQGAKECLEGISDDFNPDEEHDKWSCKAGDGFEFPVAVGMVSSLGFEISVTLRIQELMKSHL